MNIEQALKAIVQTQEIILRKLNIIEPKVDLNEGRILQIQKSIDSSLQECKKYLSACREAYHNIGRVVQLQLEETEDLSNSVSNIGWG